MNTIEPLVTSVVEEAGMGLVYSVQAGLLAALFAALVVLVTLVLRRWLTPGQKCFLWMLVLARLLMPWGPASVVSVQNLIWPATSTTQTLVGYETPAAVAESIDPFSRRDAAAPAPRPVANESATWEDALSLLLPLVWILGGLFVLVQSVVVNLRFAWQVRRAPRSDDPRLLELWKACCHQADVRYAIPIVHCDELRHPALMGLLRPKLLLPADVTALADDQLRMVMLHELAHVRRLDIAVNWLLVAVRAVQWWNPVYWLAASRLANYREQACDAFVVRRLPNQPVRPYSELLLKLAERSTSGSTWRVMLPASLLGFYASYFQQRAIRQRLSALRSAGVFPGRARTILVTGVVLLLAGAGLTDAMPAQDPQEQDFAWFPTIDVTKTMEAPPVEAVRESIDTRTYDVSAAMARIQEVTPEEAPNFRYLLQHVFDTDLPGARTTPLTSPSTTSEAGAPQPGFQLDGSTLTVHATVAIHREFAKKLAAWEQSGLGQICVECRILSSDRDIAAPLGVSWHYQEASVEDAPQALLPNEPGAELRVRAQATINELLPIMATTINPRQAHKLINAGQGDRRTNMLQAPKITMFNGQAATVMDVSQTPFVVGLGADSAGVLTPRIKVLEAGTKITFRAVHSADRRMIQLSGRLEFSSIDEAYRAQANIDGEKQTLPLPTSKRCRIDVACAVEEGHSALIGFVPTNQKKRIEYVLLTPRTVTQ